MEIKPLLAPTLKQRLVEFRLQLAVAFSGETALPGARDDRTSAGQCAVAALVLRARFGGDLVSASHWGVSHWFNRVRTEDGELYDVDVTGDQFGFAPIRVAMGGTLFPRTIVRREDDVLDETWARAIRLATRAGLAELIPALGRAVEDRSAGDRTTPTRRQVIRTSTSSLARARGSRRTPRTVRPSESLPG